ncbi:unnamed protein product [Ectocarpus sp. CCAP 1310/34]|nr:unnamed protein product [Ectocarpus sp. CCAP 1310/34]
MSAEEVEFGLFNQSEPVYNNVVLPNASPFDEGFAQQNQSYDVDSVSAEEWPEPLHTREARKDKRKISFCPPVPAVNIQRLFGENPACLSCIAEDASSLAWVASLHGCTHTCTKYGKKGSDGLPLPGAECRFGFGVDGKPILDRGSMKNGRAVVYSDGTLEIDGVTVEVDGPNDQTAALELQREIDRVIRARAKAVDDNVPFEDGDDDFLVVLGNGDARGLVFYILMYTTKSNRTVNSILPLLAEAVTRIDKEDRSEPNDERMRRIVRASLCRPLSGTELGGAAVPPLVSR